MSTRKLPMHRDCRTIGSIALDRRRKKQVTKHEVFRCVFFILTFLICISFFVLLSGDEGYRCLVGKSHTRKGRENSYCVSLKNVCTISIMWLQYSFIARGRGVCSFLFGLGLKEHIEYQLFSFVSLRGILLPPIWTLAWCSRCPANFIKLSAAALNPLLNRFNPKSAISMYVGTKFIYAEDRLRSRWPKRPASLRRIKISERL